MSPDSSKPPAVPKRERTRAAILAAAEQHFAAQGIYTTTVDEIAKTAGVSVGTIYSYFPGKVGIALEFISKGLDSLEADAEKIRELPTPLDRVYAAGDAYFKFAVEHPVAARFAAIRALQPDPSPEYEELNRQCSERVHGLVLSVATEVRESMVQEQIPTRPIDEMFVFLWALWNGLSALMLRQDALAIPPELAGRAVDFARRSMVLAGRQYVADMRADGEHTEPPVDAAGAAEQVTAAKADGAPAE